MRTVFGIGSENGRSCLLRVIVGANPLKYWLGRQDSNLGMAESKSNDFALFANGHSEKSREFDVGLIKRLAGISE
jgi:hypothetical protein